VRRRRRYPGCSTAAKCAYPGACWSSSGIEPSRLLARQAARRCRAGTPGWPLSLRSDACCVRPLSKAHASSTLIFSYFAAILRTCCRAILISNGSKLTERGLFSAFAATRHWRHWVSAATWALPCARLSANDRPPSPGSVGGPGVDSANARPGRSWPGVGSGESDSV